MAMEVDAAGNKASLDDLRDALSGTAGSSDLANTLDLSLVTDTKFRVAVVAAQPDGCDAYGHSLLDLASSPIRRELREAAERCVATGVTERIAFRFAAAPDTEYATTLHRFDSAEGMCLILAGVENISRAALPGDVVFQLEVQRNLLDVMDVGVFGKTASPVSLERTNGSWRRSERRLSTTSSAKTTMPSSLMRSLLAI